MQSQEPAPEVDLSEGAAKSKSKCECPLWGLKRMFRILPVIYSYGLKTLVKSLGVPSLNQAAYTTPQAQPFH